MNNQKGFFHIGLVLGLGIIFLMLFSFGARRGYGYMGYRGYGYGPSFWYFGGPRYHYGNRSMRHGSTGGVKHRGGGFRGGK